MPTWGWFALGGGVAAAFTYFLGHTSTKRSLNFDASPFTITADPTDTATVGAHGTAVDAPAPDEHEVPEME